VRGLMEALVPDRDQDERSFSAFANGAVNMGFVVTGL
jgi:hypothetical protein